jgi:hypothetical protein
MGFISEVVQPGTRLGLDVGIVEILDTFHGALAVLATDLKRQVAILATLGDQLLCCIELALVDDALAFEQVAPAAGAGWKSSRES